MSVTYVLVSEEVGLLFAKDRSGWDNKSRGITFAGAFLVLENCLRVIVSFSCSGCVCNS